MSGRSDNHNESKQPEEEASIEDDSDSSDDAVDGDSPHRPRSNPNEFKATYFKDAENLEVNGGNFIAAGGSINPSHNRAPQGQRPHPLRQNTTFFERAKGVTIDGGYFMAAGGDVNVPIQDQPRNQVARPRRGKSLGHDNVGKKVYVPSPSRPSQKTGSPSNPSVSEKTTSSSSVAVPLAEHNPAITVSPVATNGTTTLSKAVDVRSTRHDPANTTVNPVERSTMDNTHHTFRPNLASNTVGITFQGSLNDDADRDLISIHRSGKDKELYKLIQTEIRYGVDGAVPYSILAFRLETGEDKKDCVKVELQGEFIRSAPYKTMNVKEIKSMPEKTQELIQAAVQHKETNSVQLTGGISAGKPTFLATVSRLASNNITLMHGQTNDGHFDDAKGTFSINLGVDNAVRKQLSVVNPSRFVVLLKLEKDRQPMKLKLTLAVTYRRMHRGTSEPLSKNIEEQYSGLKEFDIIKGKRAVPTS